MRLSVVRGQRLPAGQGWHEPHPVRAKLPGGHAVMVGFAVPLQAKPAGQSVQLRAPAPE